MKKLNFLLFSLLFGILIIATSCSKDDDTKIIESEVLVEYLEANGNYANSDLPSIILASDVKALMATNSVYIVDIRKPEDFDLGHIEGANNIDVGDILTHIYGVDLTNYEKVAVVCYSGQTAGFATSLLRLAGVDKAYSMKFGMCSWNAQFAGSWNNNISNTYATQFETTDVAKGPMGDLPTINTGATEGSAILTAQINDVLAEGFGEASISNTMVLDNTNDYYIVNYWAKTDYDHYGHIPGAVQYTPKEDLKLVANLKTLPTDKTIVVYCWTGQTSAFLTSYLKVLGYDAKSLKFGANGMIYDNLESHKWSESAIMGYDYVVTE